MPLSYLRTLEQDAYTLAIQFASYGIFRVGEIKGLTWDTKNENIITIKQQLVEERTLQDDMTFSHPHRVLKDPKGNPFYSIRTEELPEAGIAILRKMKELNPLYQRLDAFWCWCKSNWHPATVGTFKSCDDPALHRTTYYRTRLNRNGPNTGLSPVNTACTTLYNFLCKTKSASNPLIIRVWSTST